MPYRFTLLSLCLLFGCHSSYDYNSIEYFGAQSFVWRSVDANKGIYLLEFYNHTDSAITIPDLYSISLRNEKSGLKKLPPALVPEYWHISEGVLAIDYYTSVKYDSNDLYVSHRDSTSGGISIRRSQIVLKPNQSSRFALRIAALEKFRKVKIRVDDSLVFSFRPPTL